MKYKKIFRLLYYKPKTITMKIKNYLKLLIPMLVLFAGIVSFSSSSLLSTSKSQKVKMPPVVLKVANIDDSTDAQDAIDAAEFILLYEYLDANYDLSDEFVDNYYPVVAYTVRAVVVATRALTRNTPVMRQLAQGLAAVVGNVLANLLFFNYATNGIEERALEKNLEEYKIYCLG